MKTIKRLFCLILALCLSLPLVACGGGSLEAPTGIMLDEEYMLSWEAVEGARSYEIEIKNAESGEAVATETSRRTMFSLSDLAVGDYSVRLRSVGGAKNDVFSEWTEELGFHREYESGLIYTLTNNETEYTVTRVGTAQGDIVIEDEYRGKPVTAIGDAAFRSASTRVTSVTLGKNIRTIGASAFYNCIGLEKVTMTDSVTSIGNSAFQNCTALTTIEMSTSLTSIPDYAFARCSALADFEIGKAITSIGASAFTNCTSLTQIVLPDSVVSVGSYAFNENSALTSVTFGENIATISDHAFYGCTSLTSAVFPETLAEDVSLTVGQYAFASCTQLVHATLPAGTSAIDEGCFSASEKLEGIDIPDSVSSVGPNAFAETAMLKQQEGNRFFYADRWIVGISDECYLNLTEIEKNDLNEGTIGISDFAFIRSSATGSGYAGCPKLETVTLPASVRYIGMYAFYNSPELDALYARDGGLDIVDGYAFAHCANLTDVKFSEGLLEIGEYAFMECTNLRNNSLSDPHFLVPASVTRIGSYAFLNSGLWSSPQNGIIYAGYWVVGFSGEPVDVTLQTGEDNMIEGISDYAFYNCVTLHAPGGVFRARHIGIGAFYGCVSLAAVRLNSDVTSIGAYTFYNCGSLTQINFPESLRSIGRYAFANCVQLGYGEENPVDLSGSQVTEIGERAFYGCLRLMHLNLGTTVESIGTRAFYRCMMLRDTIIPGSVKVIGDAAFANCLSIANLTLEDGIEVIGESAFRSSHLRNIRIPDSVKVIGDLAFYEVVYCQSVTLGKNVERIGDYAFGRIAVSGSITIPASVKEIGACAFINCVNLTSVIFAGEGPALGANVFYLCPGLTIYAEEGVELPAGAWNSSFRPIVYGCTLSDDGTYVYSVTTGKMQYATALGGIADPVRADRDFVGWATEPGGEKRYDTKDLAGLPEGVTLYALYRFHVEEEPEEQGPSLEE